MNVLYEDNHIIVAVKPQNVPSQADITQDDDFLSQVREYVRVKYNKPGAAYLGLVHRLDRPAGGVMVFARTSKAAARLGAQLKNGEFQKTYYAVVTTDVPEEGTLCHYLVKDTEENCSRVVEAHTTGAKYAELAYRVVKKREGCSLLEIDLKTGRSHQIRVQLAEIGASLLGDKKYGGAECAHLCLWEFCVRVLHPTQKTELEFVCLPPKRYPWTLFFENMG